VSEEKSKNGVRRKLTESESQEHTHKKRRRRRKRCDLHNPSFVFPDSGSFNQPTNCNPTFFETFSLLSLRALHVVVGCDISPAGRVPSDIFTGRRCLFDGRVKWMGMVGLDVSGAP
jgi:hypothetical protein